MSPLCEEIQNDVPSTNVIEPGPSGPAAVSAFHPAITSSLAEQPGDPAWRSILAGGILRCFSTKVRASDLASHLSGGAGVQSIPHRGRRAASHPSLGRID